MTQELLKKIYIMFFIIRYKINSLFIKEKSNTILFINDFNHTTTSLEDKYASTVYHKLYIKQDDKLKHKIRKICKAKYIYCDNYNVLMPYICKKKIKIQVWHGAIAIKKIGFLDEKIKNSKKSALKRYQKVYNAFDYYICPSEHLKEVFVKSFNIDENKILDFGYLKLDYYKSDKYKIQNDKIINSFPLLIEKLNILYVPTFRDDIEDNEKQIQTVEKLIKDFGEKYNILYKLHPKVKLNKKIDALEISSDNLENFLHYTDILITDYSSICIEGLMKKTSILYYLYDYDKYINDRGLNININDLPGEHCYNYDELKNTIINEKIKKNDFSQLKEKYIPYNIIEKDSDVSVKLIKYLNK